MDSDKLKLLKSLHLLDKIPDEQLAALDQFLKPKTVAEGGVVFEEGSPGDSLFFVVAGRVAISKKISGGQRKDLAVLGPGDCFGEMALLETSTRSARASAQGQTTLLELARQDFDRWLKSHAELAMGFFGELVQVQSQRLRRTSSELTLLFDLSSLLLEAHASAKDLLSKVLAHVVPHLQGAWSGAAYLYNVFNDEMDPVARFGDFDFSPAAAKRRGTETEAQWLEDGCYVVPLPGAERPHGYLLFHSAAPLSDEERGEQARTLTTVARLLTSAVENINFRTEESLRNRLKTSSYGSGL